MPPYKAKKKANYKMPPYSPNDEQQDDYNWCVNNNMRVSPGGINEDPDHWWIDYSVDGKTWHRSKHKYDRYQIWDTYYEMCKYFRNKYDSNKEKQEGS